MQENGGATTKKMQRMVINKRNRKKNGQKKKIPPFKSPTVDRLDVYLNDEKLRLARIAEIEKEVQEDRRKRKDEEDDRARAAAAKATEKEKQQQQQQQQQEEEARLQAAAAKEQAAATKAAEKEKQQQVQAAAAAERENAMVATNAAIAAAAASSTTSKHAQAVIAENNAAFVNASTVNDNDNTIPIPKEIPPPPEGIESFAKLATTKKPLWIHSEEVIQLMKAFLPGLSASQYTIKRLFTEMVNHYGVSHKKSSNATQLGRAIDFHLANGGKSNIDECTKQRWSAKLDMARLLMIMFGEEEDRAKWLESRQLPDRARLDDTAKKSVKVEYWIDVAAVYNDPAERVWIETENDVVNLYLRAELKSKFRVAWSASKLREQYRCLRADYEGSEAKRNYDQSGQNGPTFYPDFQRKNPVHVLLHYLLRFLPEGSVLGDLPAGATVDSQAGDTIDIASDDDNTSDDADGDVSTSTPVISRRKRSESPANSVVSHSSARSAMGKKKRQHVALSAASKKITKACDTLVSTFERVTKSMSAGRRINSVALESADNALRLVQMKGKLLSTIKVLVEGNVNEDDDALKLLRVNLRKLNQEIKDALKA